MRFVIVFLFIFIKTNVFSQDTTKLFYPSGLIKKEIVKNNGLTVSITQFYENGNREYFLNDTTEIKYYNDGQVDQISTIKEGKKNGISKTFFDNKLISEINYENNVQEGWTTTYDANSKSKTEELYKNGKQEGPVKYYNVKGSLEKIIYNKNGCPYKALYFDKNQKVILTLNSKKQIQSREGNFPLACPD